jgi:hypothetical protein
VGEPLDRLAGVKRLGGIDADQANLDLAAIEVDDHGIAIDDA